jgi:hypothetical protein
MTDDPDAARARLAEMARRLGNAAWDDQVAFLNDPTVRGLLAATDMAELDAMHQDAIRDIGNLDRAAEICGPLGWAVSGHHLEASVYGDVVRAWDARGADAVDSILAAAWRDRRGLMRTYGPMFPLGKDDDPDDVFDVLNGRQRLLDKAVEFHLAGEYEAAILIVLTQIDGVCFDWTGQGFFPDARDDQFVDDQTIAGLPTVLRAVRLIINRDVRRTTLGPRLERHAVIHGRSLSYGTEANSARCFALLAGVVDWLRARQDAQPGSGG